MNLSHRIQLDPTAAQREYFARAAGTSRLVWNWALAEWNEQYEAGGQPKAVDLKPEAVFQLIQIRAIPLARRRPQGRPLPTLCQSRQRVRELFRGQG
jgi:transposase